MRPNLIIDTRFTVFNGPWTYELFIRLLPNNTWVTEKMFNHFLQGCRPERDLLLQLLTREEAEHRWINTKVDDQEGAFPKANRLREQITEVSGSKEILKKLKHQGFKIGFVVTAGHEWVTHMLNTFNFNHVIDASTSSCMTQALLPEPAAVDGIHTELNCTPHECAFITEVPEVANWAAHAGYEVMSMQKLASILNRELEPHLVS